MNTDFAHYNEEQLRKLGELHSLLRHSDIGSSYLASLPERDRKGREQKPECSEENIPGIRNSQL